jgi:hypothetical protein
MKKKCRSQYHDRAARTVLSTGMVDATRLNLAFTCGQLRISMSETAVMIYGN